MLKKNFLHRVSKKLYLSLMYHIEQNLICNFIVAHIYFQRECVQKTIFFAFFQGQHLKTRVHKIVEGYLFIISVF